MGSIQDRIYRIVIISARKNHLRRAYYSCPFAELVFTYLPGYNLVFTPDSEVEVHCFAPNQLN